jgi:alkyldihydroxyacetonephosphate synthase
MKAGGSLSHHHGVGKLRASFMNQVNSENFEHMIVSLKDGTDPENLFGARNGQFFEKEAK